MCSSRFRHGAPGKGRLQTRQNDEDGRRSLSTTRHQPLPLSIELLRPVYEKPARCIDRPGQATTQGMGPALLPAPCPGSERCRSDDKWVEIPSGIAQEEIDEHWREHIVRGSVILPLKGEMPGIGQDRNQLSHPLVLPLSARTTIQ